MSYRSDFREAQREYYWSAPRIAVGLLFGLVLLGGLGWVVNIASQPARIVSKTFDADNVIHNYEWYHDVNGNFLARLSQIKQFKGLVASEADAQEKGRLRMEMAAMQQSCRELARRYNANSDKVNRGLFRGNSLPEHLNSGDCE